MEAQAEVTHANDLVERLRSATHDADQASADAAVRGLIALLSNPATPINVNEQAMSAGGDAALIAALKTWPTDATFVCGCLCALLHVWGSELSLFDDTSGWGFLSNPRLRHKTNLDAVLNVLQGPAGQDQMVAQAGMRLLCSHARSACGFLELPRVAGIVAETMSAHLADETIQANLPTLQSALSRERTALAAPSPTPQKTRLTPPPQTPPVSPTGIWGHGTCMFYDALGAVVACVRRTSLRCTATSQPPLLQGGEA